MGKREKKKEDEWKEKRYRCWGKGKERRKIKGMRRDI